jgi:hypothetical protein
MPTPEEVQAEIQAARTTFIDNVLAAVGATVPAESVSALRSFVNGLITEGTDHDAAVIRTREFLSSPAMRPDSPY